MVDRDQPAPEQRADEPRPGPEAAADAGRSTVGTGSVLGIGCLVVVALFVLLAVVFRLLGGTW